MYPQLTIDHAKIGKNVRRLIELCKGYGIEITGVTKVFEGDPLIVSTYLKNGLKKIGDSRIINLKKLKNFDCEKWLIRMPCISEAQDTVTYADVSLNSETVTLKALEDACLKLGKTHKIVLMYDLGDIREGYIDRDEIRAAADFVKRSPVLKLMGVGTNLTCFSFIQPDTEKLELLLDVAKDIGAETYISGGNSATLDLMLRGGIPKGVNLLRLGESLLFGRERAKYTYLEGTCNDAFILDAEIIELKEKPSVPWGTVGKDSYGRTPVFKDYGIRKKAICALGKQDADIQTMWPLDPDINILGASSDHLMVDITESRKNYKVGDVISLRLGYFSLMQAYTSPYVVKKHINME